MEKLPKFEIILIAIIFDPKNKKILLVKRKSKSRKPELEWCFPGGWANFKEDVDKTLKEKIIKKTGYRIKNMGSIFSQQNPEKNDLVEIYFLTQIFEGKEKAGDNIVELKWVSPSEIDEYLRIPLHRKLREFLSELV
jgi:ADP-ribose pyrophosphatase YjhB (NUDIX family)